MIAEDKRRLMQSMENQGFDTILATFAWCAIRRHLRHFLDNDAAFSAVFVVDETLLAREFEQKSRRLIAQNRQDDHAVKLIPDGQASIGDLINVSRHRQSILVFENEDDIPDSFRQSASAFAKIGRPDEGSIRAAVFKLLGVRINDNDANILRHFALTDLAFAFRNGTSFERGMSGLRRAYSPAPERMTAARKAISKAFSRVKEVPAKRRSKPEVLKALSGYGNAVAWGLQLCRDFDDFRDRKIEWAAVERGLLLYGPPGTGKTRFGRRLAEACDAPIFIGSYAEWQKSGHQGDMLKAMSKMFEDARKSAPSIVLIDELDGFVSRSGKRGGDSDTYMRGVVNGLLEQLDGGKTGEGVVVIGMTNDIASIDPAILRSNRIDTHIEIPLPDDAARCSIVEGYLGSLVPIDMREEIIQRTSGSSGSDLEVHVKRARALARRQDEDVTVRHLLEVLPPLISAPDELRWAAAIHEAGHVLVGVALKREIVCAEVSKRYSTGRHQGFVRFEPRGLARVTRSQLDEDMMVILAGIAAEREVLGQHDIASSGTSDSDLAMATSLASRIELVHGMGIGLASEVMTTDNGLDRLRQFNPSVAARIDSILQAVAVRTGAIIRENRQALETLARELLEQEKMSGQAIREFLEANTVVISSTAAQSASSYGVGN